MNDDFVAGADHYRAMAMATADVDHKALLLFHCRRVTGDG